MAARTKTAPGIRKKASRRRDAGRPRGAPVADAVLDRTLEELATVGVAQLSVDRIARAADVNKTSVYRRWPTREALIAAALERVLAQLTGMQEEQEFTSLRDELLALGENVASLLSQPVGRALAQAVFAEQTAPSLAALARRRLEESAGGPAARMVQRAIERGEWRHDADPVPVLSMLVGAILHRLMLERHEPSRAWLEGVVDILLHGVRPHRGRSAP
jgi:AcrR family transcriptional regulator